MKRILILTLAAGLLSAGTPGVLAQVSTNSTSQSQTPKPDAQKRQADRRKLMKLVGLTPQELKGLAPEERRAKIKEATEQKITQLEQKKTDGTITAEEQSDLAFLQNPPKHAKAKPKSDN